jgi:di/tricarboxylate transporter
MPLLLAANVALCSVARVVESTTSVSDIPFNVWASRLELFTAIVMLPFVPPLAAVYDVSVPRSTNATLGTLPDPLFPIVEVAFAATLACMVFAGVAGCGGFAASAPAGTAATATAAPRAIFLIRISNLPHRRRIRFGLAVFFYANTVMRRCSIHVRVAKTFDSHRGPSSASPARPWTGPEPGEPPTVLARRRT